MDEKKDFQTIRVIKYVLVISPYLLLILLLIFTNQFDKREIEIKSEFLKEVAIGNDYENIVKALGVPEKEFEKGEVIDLSHFVTTSNQQTVSDEKVLFYSDSIFGFLLHFDKDLKLIKIEEIKT